MRKARSGRVGLGMSGKQGWMLLGAMASSLAWAQPAQPVKPQAAQAPQLAQAAEPAQKPASQAPATAALTLRDLLEGVLASHPALQAARMQAQAAREDVTAAERLRWPTLSITTESERAANNPAYTSAKVFRAEQTLWDFGRISGRVAETQAMARVTDVQTALTQQDLHLQVVNGWQLLVGGLEKERVALRALGLLQGYQAQMQRRVQAQASPQIDQELVDARVLQTEVELMSARTQIAQAVTRLEQLSGLKNLAARAHSVRPALDLAQTEAFAKALEAADWAQMAGAHNTVEKARIEREVLEQRLQTKQAELKPQLYFRLDKPLDTSATVASTDASYFVGLRYTPQAGFAGHAEAQALLTRLQGQALTVDAAQREMLQTMLIDRDEFFNARLRMGGLDKSVASSEVVLESYLRQFQAGRKSWLDLLNTARELAQNEYAQAEARVTLVGAMQRLQLRMGQRPGQS